MILKEGTRNKLSEAEFFLIQMESLEAEPKVFRYNLGAFLCAFQSILWVMQTEFVNEQRSKRKGFEKWLAQREFDDWWADQEGRDAEVLLLCKIRHYNVHIRRIDLVQHLEAAEVAKLKTIEGGKLNITHGDGSSKRVDIPRSSSEDTSEPSETILQHRLCFDVPLEVKEIKKWINDHEEALKNKGIDTNVLSKDIDALLETPTIQICRNGLSKLKRVVSDCEQRFST